MGRRCITTRFAINYKGMRPYQLEYLAVVVESTDITQSIDPAQELAVLVLILITRSIACTVL